MTSFFLTSLISKSQFYTLPAEYFFSLTHEKTFGSPDSSLHTAFKPYMPGFSKKYAVASDTSVFFKGTKHQNLLDALFNRHLIQIKSKNKDNNAFDLFIDPLLNLEYGKDFSDASGEQLYTNTRGIIAGGHLGTNVYFETLLSENQSFFPTYLDSFATEQKVIPGQGRWKTFKTSGYDYAFSSGFVSVQAGKHLNIQFGHGKHKIGNGYRSLFLSDNAFNYPYLRFTQQWFKGRLQYSNLYTVFMNLVPALENPPAATEPLFQKKAASFQYLSVNAGKRLQLGFFQGLMWEPADGNNQQHLDARYFNPFIYTNLAAFGLNDSKHNLIIGTELNIKITKSLSAYGQFVLDDVSPVGYSPSQGSGYQAGLKYFDAFTVKGLFLQIEYNSTGVVQYNTNQNGLVPYYTHYNQNLASAFPNGSELVLIGNYTFKRFFVNAKFNSQNVDSGNSNPSYNTLLMQGRIGYLINPAYNLNIYLSINNRLQKFDNFSSTYNETRYVSIGLKTGLYNLYYDF
ncbi:MAG: hypothetical protein MUF75_02940 [Bacteroidia bacterium]|jgi:hypothetical protein|nr:hypothetical protein [Bacteroidia bacterium]